MVISLFSGVIGDLDRSNVKAFSEMRWSAGER
jgi:hypothetical protein